MNKEAENIPQKTKTQKAKHQKAMMRNGKYLVEVDSDAVDDIIAFSLKSHLLMLKNDMQMRKEGGGFGFWSSDPKEDVKEYKRMIKAMQNVLWYYSGEETDDYPSKT